MAKLKNSLVIAIILAGVGCDSFAQFGSGGIGGMGGMRRNRSGETASSAKTDENSVPVVSRLEQVTNKLFDLRMRLLITPEQSPLWEIFYAKVIELSTTVSRGPSVSGEQTALQAMQRRLTVAQNRFTLTEDIYEAVKKLYASLTPEQQRTADQWLPQAVPDLGADAAQRMGTRNSRY